MSALSVRRFTEPHLLALAGIVLLSAAVNVWWVHRFRDGFPVDIDEARYIAFGLKLHDAASPSALWNAWSTQHAFGPLLPLVSAPLYTIFGRSLGTAFGSQLVFSTILIVSCYGIGRRLARSRNAGLLAALAVACMPCVIDYSRTYQFAIPAAALLAASTYALLASEGMTIPAWSLAWGALLGLMVLARTMTVAFLPAQLLLALWFVVDPRRGHPRADRVVNFMVGLAVVVAVASLWLATSFDQTFTYLTSFGYGSHASNFAKSGSRLVPGYWTREAVYGIRLDLYLPLAAVFVTGLVAGGVGLLARRREYRSELGTRLADWARRDSFVVTAVVIEGYLALTSSRNEGVGFRVPVLALVATLCVFVIWRLPSPRLRISLIGAACLASAISFLSQADFSAEISRPWMANVPAIGTVPVKTDSSHIERYVIAAFEASAPPPAQPFPDTERGWLDAYGAISRRIAEYSATEHVHPVVLMSADEPLLNNNDVALAARLDDRLDLPVRLAPVPTRTSGPAWRRSVLSAPPAANVLVGVDRPAFDYRATPTPQALDSKPWEKAARSLGFRSMGSFELPDGRRVSVSARVSRPQ